MGKVEEIASHLSTCSGIDLTSFEHLELDQNICNKENSCRYAILPSCQRTMPLNDVICLNVGGASMATSRATLLSEPASSLARMFQEDSEIPPAKLKDGEFFLDLDPKCFEVVHNTH